MTLKHNYLLAFTLLYSLFLSESCIAQKLPEEQMRFHKTNAENGLICGSITFTNSKPKYNAYFLLFSFDSEDKKEKRKNSSEIRVSPEQFFKLKHNGELEDGKTYLFAIEKKPGFYSIPKVRLATNGGLGAVRDDLINKFSIPFEVKKGEITYIGEIVINEYTVPGEPIIKVTDQFERDIRALKNRQKMINWDAAVKSELKINYGEAKKEEE